MEQIYLNLIPGGVSPVCYVSQYDVGRKIRLHLREGSDPYVLSGAETINATIRKATGEELIYDIANTSASYVDLVVNYDATDVIGESVCELVITNSGKKIGSANFKMRIDPDVYGNSLEIKTASGNPCSFITDVAGVLADCNCEIPYNADGYTGLKIINSSTAPVFNKTPYRFRKTPTGNNCLEELNGLSVVVNQNCQVVEGALLDNVATKTYSDGVWTFTATDLSSDSVGWYAAYSVKANHVCFIATDVNPTNNITMKLGMMDRTLFNVSGGTYTRLETLRKQNIDARPVCYAMLNGQGLSSFSFSCKNVIFIDLTQMLGSTIADYIYSLETQTAGAGVSLFKSLGFDDPYYPYNTGSLMSSIPVAKRAIGKNLFNKNGSLTPHYFINSGGNFVASADWNVIDYEEIVPGNYTMSGETDPGSYYCICWYDSSKNYISGYEVFTRNPTTVTIPQGAKYVRYSVHNTAFNTFMLEYGSEATTYETYKETFIDLGGDILRGIPKRDSNNNIYAYGDIKTSDGKIKRRFNTVDLGTLTWVKQEFYNSKYGFLAYLTDIKPVSSPTTKANMICDTYITDTGNNVYLGNEGISMWSAENRISIYDSSLESLTAEQFKTAMSGKYLIYEVETPTIESSTPFDNPQVSGSIEQVIDGNFYGVINLDSVSWSNASTTTYGAKEHHSWNQTYIKPVLNNNIVFNAYITNDLNIASANAGYSNAITDCITIDTGSNLYIYSEKYENMDSEQFKAAMSGVYLYYEKNTSVGVEIPLSHNSIYGTDIEYKDINFDTTIYGGEIDAVDGKLSSEYNSDGSVKPTPEVINVTPTYIPVKDGNNNIVSSANSTVTAKYFKQVGGDS